MGSTKAPRVLSPEESWGATAACTVTGKRHVVSMGHVVAKHDVPLVNPSTGAPLGCRIARGGVFEVWCTLPYDPTLISLTAKVGKGNFETRRTITNEAHVREHFEMVLDPSNR